MKKSAKGENRKGKLMGQFFDGRGGGKNKSTNTKHLCTLLFVFPLVIFPSFLRWRLNVEVEKIHTYRV